MRVPPSQSATRLAVISKAWSRWRRRIVRVMRVRTRAEREDFQPFGDAAEAVGQTKETVGLRLHRTGDVDQKKDAALGELSS